MQISVVTQFIEGDNMFLSSVEPNLIFSVVWAFIQLNSNLLTRTLSNISHLETALSLPLQAIYHNQASGTHTHKCVFMCVHHSD